MVSVRIIEHRARWCSGLDNFHDKTYQNTLYAFKKSFSVGNGVETDLRNDADGSILVCHDSFFQEKIRFEDILTLYREFGKSATLALNIKSDGLAGSLRKLLDKHHITNFFTFDMSIPDSLSYVSMALNPYIRHSEYERNPEKASPELYKSAKGVWLDQFVDPMTGICPHSNLLFPAFKKKVPWIDKSVIESHLIKGKSIALVSPELHPWGRRESDKLYFWVWKFWKDDFSVLSRTYDISEIAICTDFPEEAQYFFNEN